MAFLIRVKSNPKIKTIERIFKRIPKTIISFFIVNRLFSEKKYSFQNFFSFELKKQYNWQLFNYLITLNIHLISRG